VENIRNNLAVISIIIVAIILCLIAGYFLSDKEQIYYTRIDNTKMEEISDADDNMKYQYALTGYNENGRSKELKFKTSRELRNEAFLKLEVMNLVRS